ncbi:hypothetical protein BCR43DRAFT_518913 [Syncephalastrum racemosum]|uniref:ACB domain-containing protein n=1 Tax=Syncephalastrum racemosum TaxID=13706 RepID=A0A1X2H050_SYNRA|nr:hypothetical protein BCR43DRAFT_518913 [Syncephalastrum racemosum]
MISQKQEFEEALVDEERRCQPFLDELLQEDEKLRLFALKNQGQFRNASLKHACISRCKNSAEWKAWSKLKGMKAEDAQIEYIKLLNYLMQKYNIGRWI